MSPNLHIKLEDLPPHILKMVAAKDREALGIVVKAGSPVGIIESPAEGIHVLPRYRSATERDFHKNHLHGEGCHEPVTFRLPGGSRYTPDFMTSDDGVATFYEVKGSYRLHSHARALTAFRECRAAFPMFRFRWFEKTSGGGFAEKHARKEQTHE